ncbi:glycoside hydrolase family 16 protein [Asticcacaulis benevestitus]|nr:glycoside hydrolase family 16 protein [Asticcacaulis benevestitus]
MTKYLAPPSGLLIVSIFCIAVGDTLDALGYESSNFKTFQSHWIGSLKERAMPHVVKKKRVKRTPVRAEKTTDPKSGSLTRRLLLGAGAIGVVTASAYSILQAQDSNPQKIDLSKYTLTFSEEFDDPNFSLKEFSKRWYPHTPWWGDFGEAMFVDPVPGFPFFVANGSLQIEARKGSDGKWRSGIMSSVNHEGFGFTQQYGYFEVRAKLPPGEGTWPAFWLNSWSPTMTDPNVEIDVFEYYGQFPDALHSTVTVWPKDGTQKRGKNNIHRVEGGTLTADYHRYGVSVEPDWVVMYLDGVETWRTETPPEHKHPLMVLVDLALGSGWSTDNTPNPSDLLVDYVRVYKRSNA